MGLTNLQTEKIKAQNQINNGYLGLKLLMGMPVKDELVLTDNITDDDIKQGMLDATAFQYTDRKEFQYAELGIKLNEYNIRRYKLSKLPTVSLNGYYNKNAQRNKFDFFGWRMVWHFCIYASCNVPIFNGFSTKCKDSKAKLELQKNINRRDNLKLLLIMK